VGDPQTRETKLRGEGVRSERARRKKRKTDNWGFPTFVVGMLAGAGTGLLVLLVVVASVGHPSKESRELAVAVCGLVQIGLSLLVSRADSRSELLDEFIVGYTVGGVLCGAFLAVTGVAFLLNL
jgi:hypothetical protein